MSERAELVGKAAAGERITDLSLAYGVSRKTAYKWLGRYAAAGASGLADHSRRPKRSPMQTPAAVEALVCELRREHPAWGGRKLHHRLRMDGVAEVPAPSTITDILARNSLLSAERRLKRDWQRFEAERPNSLWQMDFKGHFQTEEGRCHPLTICDDHSRFNICLAACPNEQAETVQRELGRAFERYGLPERMLMDNGPPWGSAYVWQPHTHLTTWLIRLGITVLHGRSYHPQTQGKEERFHRTLLLEVINRPQSWQTFADVQAEFDPWREVYNWRRPHESLAYDVPASRYRPSALPFPRTLPEIHYEAGDQVRKVDDNGKVSFRGCMYHVGRAFIGEPVSLRTVADGIWNVYYCHQRVGKVDITSASRPKQV